MIINRENSTKPHFWPLLAPFGPNLGPNILYQKSGFVTFQRVALKTNILSVISFVQFFWELHDVCIEHKSPNMP